MKYQVFWSKSAENRLAKLWLASTDRKRLSSAANEIDRDLALKLWELGESREGPNRVYFSAPLGVIYRINDQSNIVTVLSVWQFNKRI